MTKKSMTRAARKEFCGEVSKFLIDVAKLIFAGVILAGILKEDISVFWLLAGGLIASSLCLYGGNFYFKLSKKI